MSLAILFAIFVKKVVNKENTVTFKEEYLSPTYANQSYPLHLSNFDVAVNIHFLDGLPHLNIIDNLDMYFTFTFNYIVSAYYEINGT
jgi:hypothetical protein